MWRSSTDQECKSSADKTETYHHLWFTEVELLGNILTVSYPTPFRLSSPKVQKKTSRLPRLKTSISFIKVHPSLTLKPKTQRKSAPTSFMHIAYCANLRVPFPDLFGCLERSWFGLLPALLSEEKDKWMDRGGM